MQKYDNFSNYQIILNIFNKWFIYSIIFAIVQHVLYIVCELSRAWNDCDNSYWHTCSIVFVITVPKPWYDCDTWSNYFAMIYKIRSFCANQYGRYFMHIFIVGTEMVKINTNAKKFTTIEGWSMPIWYNIFLIAKR